MGNKSVHKFFFKKLFLVVTLSVLGFAGNTLALPISFGVSFIFGSIFSIIALIQFGLWAGAGVTLIASSYTYVLWSHPWAIIIFTAEILWMGIAIRRGKSNLLLIDALYWLFLGSSLVTLFYGGIMGVGAQQTIIIILKQGLNGVLNVLAAWIILSVLSVSTWLGSDSPVIRQNRPYTQIIFQIAAVFLMVPALGILLILTHGEISASQKKIIQNMKVESHMMANSISRWVAGHINAVRIISKLETRSLLASSAKLQNELKRIHELFPDFLNIMLCNGAGVAIGYDPPTNEKGQSTIGSNFVDRGWFKELKRSLQPTISNAFVGHSRVIVPMVAISVPIIRDGKLSHFGLGSIDLGLMQNELQQVSDEQNMTTTIVDRNNKIIISTDKSRKPLEPLVLQDGQTVHVNSEVDLWLPGAKKEVNILQAWKNAYFFSRLPIAETPWTMVIEYPVALMQKHFFDMAIGGLSVVAGFFVVMILLAAIISRLLTKPIISLAEVSKNLPDRIARHEHIVWSQSNFAELTELIDNFQQSAMTLDENLTKINQHNL